MYTDDYRSHTSCISEAERYEKTVYKGVRKLDQQNNGSQPKKNLTKQEKWLLVIEKAAASSPPSLKHYMDTLTSLENIPTQEKKFRNFAANSLRLKKSDEKIVSQIWELLMKERQKETEAIETQKQAVAAEKQKEEQAAATAKASESAKISDEENSKEQPSADNLPSDSNLKKAMKKALKKASNKTLKFKALRKEVKSKLELKNVDDKKMKEMMKQIVDENPKMKIDGKSVQLIDS